MVERTFRYARCVCLWTSVGLMLAAGRCLGDGPPRAEAGNSAPGVTKSADGAVQATPGTKPAVTTTPPKPAEKPAEKPAAKPEAKPPAKPPIEPSGSELQRPTRQPPPDLLAMSNSPPIERLAAIPAMFGDLPFMAGQLQFRSLNAPGNTVDLPLAGGGSRMKIAEDNSPWTDDRVFFLYNHYAHAVDVDLGSLNVGVPRSLPLDRYTLGVEKSFFDHSWSVELRMPVAGQSELSVPGFNLAGGNAGNLQVNVKRLVYQSEETALSAGLGIDVPTGSDVRCGVPSGEFTLRNDAVHLMPFIGLLRRPDERFFWQAFLQVDVPTIGNRVEFDNARGVGQLLGRFDEQTLLYADISAGYWLYRNAEHAGLTGLAAIAEVHNTTALSNPDTVAEGATLFPTFVFGYRTEHMDIVDVTFGLHAELGGSTICRVGAAMPITNADNRAFDAELQVQLERHF
jgi:hypothetical protein